MEEPLHLVFETGAEDQPIVQTSQHPEWFSQPRRLPTPDYDWNKTLPAAQGNAQSWISELERQTDARSSFNELLDTLIDFSNFIMNRLGVDTLTPELLAGPTYELMRGSCNSLTEFEYHLEEVYKATTDQLDWVNPEDLVPRAMWIQEPINYDRHALWEVSHWGRKRQQFYRFTVNQESALDVYSKRRIIAVTKLKIVEWHNYKHLDWISIRRDDDKIYKFKEGDFKRLRLQDIEDMLLLLAADYGHIKWIEDLVPREMWIQQPIDYNKHALWGVSHWGRKRKQFYGYAVNRESARDVYSKRRIIAFIDLQIMECHDYKHLDWISVRRDDDQIYKFKEGDFKRLRLQDIEDMLLLLVQGKLSNLTIEERLAFNVSLRMFTRSIVIQRRVEDLQLG
nr:hypothetical protein [Tanacetum cinerariifolium]